MDCDLRRSFEESLCSIRNVSVYRSGQLLRPTLLSQSRWLLSLHQDVLCALAAYILTDLFTDRNEILLVPLKLDALLSESIGEFIVDAT